MTWPKSKNPMSHEALSKAWREGKHPYTPKQQAARKRNMDIGRVHALLSTARELHRSNIIEAHELGLITDGCHRALHRIKNRPLSSS